MPWRDLALEDPGVAQHVEPASPRHIDVKQYKLPRLARQPVHGLPRVLGLGDLGVGMLLEQQVAQPVAHNVVIVGDYTARIGDPSGRSKTRPPLEPEAL